MNPAHEPTQNGERPRIGGQVEPQVLRLSKSPQLRDKNFPGFTDVLPIVCAAVKHPERFAQTGTGWVVRELEMDQVEGEQVVHFLETVCRLSQQRGYATL